MVFQTEPGPDRDVARAPEESKPSDTRNVLLNLDLQLLQPPIQFAHDIELSRRQFPAKPERGPLLCLGL